MEKFDDHSVFAQAIWFAAEAHCNTFRKGTNTPYIVHPMEAAIIASQLTDDPEIMAAAMLHDVVEDTQAEIEDVERMFSKRVASIVAEVSEDKMADRPAEDTWKARKLDALKMYEKASDEAKIVILADKLSNIRSIAADKAKLGDKIWDRFNQKDRSQIRWYYEEALGCLGSLKDTPQWEELAGLIETVFD